MQNARSTINSTFETKPWGNKASIVIHHSEFQSWIVNNSRFKHPSKPNRECSIFSIQDSSVPRLQDPMYNNRAYSRFNIHDSIVPRLQDPTRNVQYAIFNVHDSNDHPTTRYRHSKSAPQKAVLQCGEIWNALQKKMLKTMITKHRPQLAFWVFILQTPDSRPRAQGLIPTAAPES